MSVSVEQTAISMLSAVINLYGADAYADIVSAFRCALAQPDEASVNKTLCDALLEVVRARTLSLTGGE